MTKTFEVSVDSPITVEQVCAALGTHDYWYDRFVEFDTATTLDALSVNDGVIDVTTTQDLRSDSLPSFLAKIYPGNLQVRTVEVWRPVADGRVLGDLDISVIGAPGSGRGDAILSALEIGSQLQFNGSVEIRIPLVGGRIERYVCDEFTHHIPDIQRFTTEWITQHG